MKNFKKFFCSCMAVTVVLSLAAVPAFAYSNNDNGGNHKIVSSYSSGNYHDTLFTVSAIDNEGGTPYYTDFRTKEDATSSYVRSDSSNQSNLYCWVIRSSDGNYDGDVTDRYYGHDTYNGASQNQVRVAPGQHAYLKNYVHEDGYNYAGIGFIMQREAVEYNFYWSPDSI